MSDTHTKEISLQQTALAVLEAIEAYEAHSMSQPIAEAIAEFVEGNGGNSEDETTYDITFVKVLEEMVKILKES